MSVIVDNLVTDLKFKCAYYTIIDFVTFLFSVLIYCYFECSVYCIISTVSFLFVLVAVTL